MNKFLDAKIIGTKDFSCEEKAEEWLKLRQTGVCGSDIAKLAGYSKYGSPLTVYREKKGTVVNEINSKSYFAGRMQSVLCDFAKEDIKEELKLNLEFEKFPHMICHKDNQRFMGNIAYIGSIDMDFPIAELMEDGRTTNKVIKAKEKIGIEIKITNRHFRENEKEMMDEYSVKCQWYMGLTGMNFFLLIVLSQNEIRYKIIPRNNEKIALLQRLANGFLEENLDKNIEPKPSGIEVDKKLILEGLKLDETKKVKLPKGILENIKKHDFMINKMCIEREKLNQELILMLGDAKSGDDGKYKATRSIITRNPVDTTKLKLDFPKIYKDVLKKRTSYLNMRITKL